MKLTDAQRAALTLAVTDGYVRPASDTHARRCQTTNGQLDRTCKGLVRLGLMRRMSEARYQPTDKGHEQVPSTPAHPRESWMF